MLTLLPGKTCTLFLFLISAFLNVVNSETDTDLTVKTQFGWIRGTTRKALESDRDVYSFFGVPYARSPDYTFRFRPPVDPWVWEGVKDATSENVAFCSQDRNALNNFRKDTWFNALIDSNQTLSENCLTLNVFSPTKPSEAAKSTGLPVLVWIHGGGLQFAASTPKMWMLSAFEDVLVVSIQYRVGVFGFLTLEDDWAPGNSGLMDQVKALKWVRDNIRAFGGDPQKVTLIGQSSGGFSVSAHMMSPKSEGLFHRAVAMSGAVTLPPNDPEFQHHNPAEQTIKLAEKLKCKFWDNAHTSTCLRNHVTTSEMIGATNSLNMKFYPTLDGEFFTDYPNKKLKSGQFDPKIPLLLGVVSGEMDFVLGRKFIPNFDKASLHTHKSAEVLIRDDLAKYHPHLKNSKKIIEEYIGSTKPGTETVKAEADYLTDSWYSSKAANIGKAYTELFSGAQVYLYEFAAQPSLTRVLNPRPYDFKRADHCDDLLFFLGFPFLPHLQERGLTFTLQERELSRKLMKILATFAETGSPEISKMLSWPLFPKSVYINDTLTIRNKFRQKRMNLFEDH